MSSDISRQRFDSAKDFAAVLMQQGRVLLDADWNEWVEILDRHLRAETMDIIGRATVPKETPHAFEIAFSGGNLTIGPGRIYVDGILAENHGLEPFEWNPALADLQGTAPVVLSQQPYLPEPKLLDPPFATVGGPHLIYLDVWRRELTWVEDSQLVESAVGVDSTSRWQTVWQVRMLPNAGGTCATPDASIPKWLETIGPSAGRLTTGTINLPEDPNPCLVPPTGGYKGLENRLYRVEIHSVDAGGDATFKWARHNASVASPISSIAGENLTVERIGRDLDLRFKTGDWVEITDDALELAGLPGIMRKLKNVIDETRTIVIDGALPAGTFPSGGNGNTLPERHTRVRRWDQAGQVRNATGAVHHDLNLPELDEARKGVIPVPAAGTALLLEDGIHVSFSLDPSGGRYRVGDYWVFAARTADASIEVLTESPPRGIHHHYCRLAMVTFPGTVEDCRTLWPPEFGEEGCECTVCVTADSHNQGTLTIQQAIDEVRVKGGIVCLGPGIFNVPEQPLVVKDARSVRIRGKGWRTVIAHTGPGPTMVVSGTIGLTVENLSLLTAGAGAGTADVALSNSADLCLQECYFVQAGGGDARAKAAIGLSGVLLRTRIRENVFFTSAGIANAGVSEGDDQRPPPLLTLDFRCDGNVFLCASHGLRLSDFCLHFGEMVVARNSITGTNEAGLLMTGAVRADVWGGSRLDVSGNTFRGDGDGIVLGTDEARIDGNDLGPESEKRTGRGIVIERGFSDKPLNHLQITTNRIQDTQGHAIHLRAPLRSAMIKQNQIERINGGGIIMDGDSTAEHVVIENNQLLQVVNVSADASRAEHLSAIQVVRARDADVINNVLRDVGAHTLIAASLAGIQFVACARMRVAGNRVINFGPNEKFTAEVEAITVSGPYNNVEIIDNTVQRQEDLAIDESRWRAVRIGPLGAKLPGSFIAGKMLVTFAKTVTAVLTEAYAVIRPISIGAVALRGNVLLAYGSEPAVLLVSAGTLAISDNRVTLLQEAAAPALVADASTVILNANYFDNGRADMDGHASVRVQVPKERFTVLGNFASSRILVAGVLNEPWKSLNRENALP
jgi:hypothetical protein